MTFHDQQMSTNRTFTEQSQQQQQQQQEKQQTATTMITKLCAPVQRLLAAPLWGVKIVD